MIKIWILIMLIDGEQSAYTVTAEFNTLETCQTAAKSIIQQQTYGDGKYTHVQSWGCYQK